MKSRVNYLTVAQQYDLMHACRAAEVAFRELGYGIFHVGSSVERPDWRDVDIRTMLENEVFDAWFKDAPHRLRFLNVCISEWLSARTGLPVDFQFQRQAEANTEFRGRPRNFIAPPIEGA